MLSRAHCSSPLAALAVLLLPWTASAQEDMARGTTAEALIANAVSAAPRSIAEHAAVMDAEGTELRAGTNGFTCMPDNPDLPGNTPLCADEVWMDFIQAWIDGSDPPEATTAGVVYALQGGWPASNTDPYATGPTDDNEWLDATPPHIAVRVPAALMEGVGSDPHAGTPWVMWRDTPFAHVMVPTGD